MYGILFWVFSLNKISARSLGWCHIMTYSPLLKEPFGEAPFIIKTSVMAGSYSSKSLRKKFRMQGFFQPLLSISINLKPLRSSNPVAFKQTYFPMFPGTDRFQPGIEIPWIHGLLQASESAPTPAATQQAVWLLLLFCSGNVSKKRITMVMRTFWIWNM